MNRITSIENKDKQRDLKNTEDYKKIKDFVSKNVSNEKQDYVMNLLIGLSLMSEEKYFPIWTGHQLD